MLSTDSTDILFSKARSHKAWLDQDINDNQIQQIYNLLKFAPTSGNCCPARFTFVRSEESKQKMSQSKKGKPNPSNNKPILQFDKQGIFIQEHPSIKAASEIVKGNQSAIHNALKKGKGATSSSYIWKYKE